MEKCLEDTSTELHDISSALAFISEALVCHESEGKEVNKGGVAYLVKVISDRSEKLADLCWSLKDSARSDCCSSEIEY